MHAVLVGLCGGLDARFCLVVAETDARLREDDLAVSLDVAFHVFDAFVVLQRGFVVDYRREEAVVVEWNGEALAEAV